MLARFLGPVYRLVMEGPNQPADGAKPQAAAAGGNLQGWAIVENQTDNDWNNVQMSLVSGRPISFIQDLYQPLYVPRPVVQPELYASLRPQTYEAGMELQEGRAGKEAMRLEEEQDRAADEKAKNGVLRKAIKRELAAAPNFDLMRAGGGAGMIVLQEHAGECPTLHFAFAVNEGDLERAATVLRERGVATMGPIVHEWIPGKSLYFRDPDGHDLELFASTAT